jgi:DNA polymerase-3 subunit epsilon
MKSSESINNFVAIDIEYSDSAQNICQFGLTVVNELQVVEQKCWNIQPPRNHYEEKYTKIHHMTESDTIDAPTFPEAWKEIKTYLQGKTLWAHNAAAVEQPILEKNLRRHNIPHKLYRVIDSRNLYRRPGGKGNGLEQCCMALGIPCNNHHNAAADSYMCAEIIIAYIKGQQPNWKNVPMTNEDLRKAKQNKRLLRIGEFLEYFEKNPSGKEDVLCEVSSTFCGAKPQIIDVFDKGDKKKKDNIEVVNFTRLDKSESNPLYGKRVIVTGMFSSFNRKEIESAVETMGAKLVPTPAKNTDAVIMGTRNVGPNKLCGIEEQKAKGHHIALIVGDSDLNALLYGDGHKFFK